MQDRPKGRYVRYCYEKSDGARCPVINGELPDRRESSRDAAQESFAGRRHALPCKHGGSPTEAMQYEYAR